MLVYEAVLRVLHPGDHIHGDWMTGIAAIGLVISMFSVFVQHSIETDIVDAIILGYGGASHGHSHGGGDDHGHSHGGGEGEVESGVWCSYSS